MMPIDEICGDGTKDIMNQPKHSPPPWRAEGKRAYATILPAARTQPEEEIMRHRNRDAFTLIELQEPGSDVAR